MVIRLADWERARKLERPAPSGVWEFGALLRRLRLRAGLSQNALARAAGVDPAYVNRLERQVAGHPHRPSCPVVYRLAAAVGAEDDELDALLASAGYLPHSVSDAGGWELYLAAWRGNLRVLEHTLEVVSTAYARVCREVVELRAREAVW